MINEKIKLNQEAVNFQEYKEKIAKKVKETNEKVVENLSSFFRFLATLSSGAIVVSVTFLGRFSKIKFAHLIIYGIPISNALILYFGWGLLFLSLLFAIYRNYYHIHYIHWNVLVEWVETIKKGEIYTIELAKNSMIFNKKDFDLGITKENISKMEEAVKENKEASKKCITKAEIFGKIAQISFVGGLLFLIIFAISVLGY